MKASVYISGLAGSCGKFHNSKKKRKLANASRTPGKEKVEACQANHIDRFMAKRSRSYKHRDFAAWSERNKKNMML